MKVSAPVVYRGVEIGKAHLSNDNDAISVELTDDQLVKDLKWVLTAGMADGISINPNFIPSPIKEY